MFTFASVGLVLKNSMRSSSTISLYQTTSPSTRRSAIDSMWASQCPACVLMTSLGQIVFSNFGRALLMLLISFSCPMMQVAAVFPPEFFSACMCRTALLTKLWTRLFQVFLAMWVSSSNNLSNISALVIRCSKTKKKGGMRYTCMEVYSK